MTKVSVIIPIYNVEEYIEECLVSALHQTLKDIEIICVNDGTPDDSMRIVKSYAAKDDRIVIVEKENGGLSSARNAGIKAANGEFVYFLDSDDYIQDNMLEVLYEECSTKDLDNIYFDAESFFENEELEQKHKNYKDYYRRPSMFQEVVSGPELFAKMENLREFKPSACLQMIKRSLLTENGISFYEGILHEDNLFSLQVIFAAKRTKHMAVPFYKRRVREASIMTAGQEFRRSYGYYICISEFYKFVKQFDFKDPEIIKAIRHRIYAMQNNAAKTIQTITVEDIDEELVNYPLETQVEYAVIIRRLVKERQLRKEKLDLLKESSKEAMDKIKSSAAYRTGDIMTKIPRKIYHFIKNIKDKGVVCTLYGVKRKLAKEKHDLEPKKTAVSVIIPMYNAEKYLRECLDRLLRQTLKSIEIICVNDGSTDGTADILAEYEKKDSRVKVVYQENQGAGPARNHGMEHAKGEYLLFLDADDIFHEKLCEEAYYKAKYDMADIVLFEAFRFNVQSGEKEEMNWVLKEQLLPGKLPFSAKDTKQKMYQITTGCPWSKMFSRKFVEKYSLEFQNTKNANDVFFVRSALALAKRITVLKKRLVTYRFNDGSNTQSGKSKAPVEFYKAFKALKLGLKERGIFERVEQSYVNMVLTESLFNLRTAGTDEAKKIVLDLLLDEGFAFFELDKYNKDYFYNKKEYKEYQELLKTER